MDNILRRAANSGSRDWLVSRWVCEALGGSESQAIPATGAIVCSQISIMMIDDMLDNDARGEHTRIGHAQAANLAAGFQALGAESLLAADLDEMAMVLALKSLNEMILKTALGQKLDTANPDTEETYWQMLSLKSAPFYETSFYLGALSAGAPLPEAEAIRDLGAVYGIMVQIHDDIYDTMKSPANADWMEGRYPLPLLFAHAVDYPEKEQFRKLKARVGEDEGALREAQSLLIRIGAISYCVHQLVQRYESARDKMAELPQAQAAGLAKLFRDLIEPVTDVFTKLNLELPASLENISIP